MARAWTREGCFRPAPAVGQGSRFLGPFCAGGRASRTRRSGLGPSRGGTSESAVPPRPCPVRTAGTRAWAPAQAWEPLLPGACPSAGGALWTAGAGLAGAALEQPKPTPCPRSRGALGPRCLCLGSAPPICPPCHCCCLFFVCCPVPTTAFPDVGLLGASLTGCPARGASGRAASGARAPSTRP